MLNHRTIIRLIYSLLLVGLVIAAFGVITLLQSKSYVYNQPIITVAKGVDLVVPFPVGVDPVRELISNIDQLNTYPSEQLAVEINPNDSWWKKVVAVFSKQEWYQNLASPVTRIIVIWPGQRKEEIAENIGGVLRWSAEDRELFIEEIGSLDPVLPEGKFYPGQYVAHRGATPNEIATMIHTEFQNKILTRYTDEVDVVVPLEEALTIASLLEREASDFENMREVSGVIWNRLFIDMPLQLDATLQYAKSKQGPKENWWPVPKPADKYTDSLYNTYKHTGLPPGPIANPSSDAVLAALNPVPTDCFYYFHDAEQNYHCSVTYEEHIDKLKAAYGSGR